MPATRSVTYNIAKKSLTMTFEIFDEAKATQRFCPRAGSGAPRLRTGGWPAGRAAAPPAIFV